MSTLDQALQEAMAKAKTDPCKPRVIAVVYKAPNGNILTAYGVEHRNGEILMEAGHGSTISGGAGSMEALRYRMEGNGIEGLVDYTDAPTQVDPTKELQDAAEAAKASPGAFKRFVVAYRKPGETVKTAHGIVNPNNSVRVEDGHGIVSGYESSLNSLRNTMSSARIEYHIAYMDEA